MVFVALLLLVVVLATDTFIVDCRRRWIVGSVERREEVRVQPEIPFQVRDLLPEASQWRKNAKLNL